MSLQEGRREGGQGEGGRGGEGESRLRLLEVARSGSDFRTRNKTFKPGVVVHAGNPNTLEAEAGDLP